LQAIPEVSITNGLPSSALPLAFVLFFDGIVTAREDYVRHRDDARANARKVLCMRNKHFVDVEWREVQVGDILKVRKGEEFPADLVFLASGTEETSRRKTALPRGTSILPPLQSTKTKNKEECATCKLPSSMGKQI
jgi:magnesium-transporting ATPase (P-type)